ncbi:hypothetical protein [Paenibacillus sp. MMS18-CY102]|uniref:hypothetical protein n=1 Tax=Paenibacillus sp. MMS18-CY102 TaxID=2682849 RepID=UPI001365D2C0|nr:hypothetical protein [Paenibacillus sp. MMS18-CY102]MWC26874.1 hypothetical protein [Paenibacillus sp. MMS18-CY102]
MTIDEVIYSYYEAMLKGKMEESQQFLDWNSKEGSVIDYFANLGKLRKKYQVVSVEDLEIAILSETDGISKVDVAIIYLDNNGDKRIEGNEVMLKLNAQNSWRITSIKGNIERE